MNAPRRKLNEPQFNMASAFQRNQTVNVDPVESRTYTRDPHAPAQQMTVAAAYIQPPFTAIGDAQDRKRAVIEKQPRQIMISSPSHRANPFKMASDNKRSTEQ